MTPSDVADDLGVPPRLLAQWRYRKVGPPYVKVEGHVRYDSDDLDEYKRRQRVTPAAS